jgi:hypothetical protein
MKQKFAVIALFLMVASLSSFAQSKKVKLPTPLVAEEGITNLVVADNIDVVFVQNKFETDGVRAAEESVSKLSAKIIDGTLFLSTTKKRVAGERIPVFVSINNLETLTLKGNAFATSRDAINTKNLQVNISRDARVSLKSNGKIFVNASGNYQVVKESGFSSLYVLD